MSEELEGLEAEIEGPRSRRRILQLAGVAGAAGAAALVAGAVPAGAANGDNWVLGESGSSNNATLPTGLIGTSALEGALNVGVNDSDGPAPAIVASGLGAGDIKCNGTGRLSQLPAAGVTGGLAPTFAPIENAGDQILHELVRSDTGILWATTGTSDAANGTSWKRINAVRVDEASGNGAAFPPARILDTRSGSPIAANATLNVQVTGEGGVPSGAVAVFGNLTAVAPNGSAFTDSGFLTLFPEGVSRPTVSNVNPATGGLAFPNFFFVGLSSGGELSVFANIQSHAVIDIFAYVQ